MWVVVVSRPVASAGCNRRHRPPRPDRAASTSCSSDFAFAWSSGATPVRSSYHGPTRVRPSGHGAVLKVVPGSGLPGADLRGYLGRSSPRVRAPEIELTTEMGLPGFRHWRPAWLGARGSGRCDRARSGGARRHGQHRFPVSPGTSLYLSMNQAPFVMLARTVRVAVATPSA